MPQPGDPLLDPFVTSHVLEHADDDDDVVGGLRRNILRTANDDTGVGQVGEPQPRQASAIGVGLDRVDGRATLSQEAGDGTAAGTDLQHAHGRLEQQAADDMAALASDIGRLGPRGGERDEFVAEVAEIGCAAQRALGGRLRAMGPRTGLAAQREKPVADMTRSAPGGRRVVRGGHRS